jgi:hypothetical protein
MSDWWDKIEVLAVRWIRCTYCQSAPGKWCVTTSGKNARYLHTGRTQPLQELYSEGYREGLEDEREMSKLRAALR